MLTFKLSENGDLIIMADSGARAELAECEDAMAREALIREWHYEPPYEFDTADSFGSNLSEAPCFIEDRLYIDDQDSCGYAERFWYFGDYIIRDFTQLLIDDGSVVFTEA